MKYYLISFLGFALVTCELLVTVNLGRHGARRAGSKESYLKE